MRHPPAGHARRLTGTLALGLALAGCGGEPRRDLTVRLVVRDAALRTPGAPCSGGRPHLDVHAAAPYRVQDGAGATLARGRLPDGRAIAEWERALGGARMPTTCQMTLRLDVPDRPRYALVLRGRAPLRFSARGGRAAAVTVGAGGPATGARSPAVGSARAATGSGSVPPSAVRRPGAGRSAPDFALPLADGGRVTGRALWRERPLVLSFVASWCGACARQHAALTALARRLGVTVLGIAGEGEPRTLARFRPVAIDASLTVWRSYAVREPPAVVLIGRGGRLLRGWPGGVDVDTLAAALRRALA